MDDTKQPVDMIKTFVTVLSLFASGKSKEQWPFGLQL